MGNSFEKENQLSEELNKEDVKAPQYNVHLEYLGLLSSSIECLGGEIEGRFSSTEHLLGYLKAQPEVGLKFSSVTYRQLYIELTDNHNSPLHIASAMGDVEKVKKLCSFYYIGSTNKDGDTPLHIACRLGHEEICKCIVDWSLAKVSIDPEKIYLTNLNSLWRIQLSSILDLYYMGIVLVAQNVPSMLMENYNHETPFQVAIKSNNFSCIKSILNTPKIDSIYINMKRKMIYLKEHLKDNNELRILYKQYLIECTNIAHNHKQHNYCELVAYIGFIPCCKNDSELFPLDTFIKVSEKRVPIIFESMTECNRYFWHNFIQINYDYFIHICEEFDLFTLFKEVWKEECNKSDKENNLLLHYICKNRTDQRTAEIFSHCDVNRINNIGKTPLWEAFSNGNYSVCAWLLFNKQCDIYCYHDRLKMSVHIGNLCNKIMEQYFCITEVTPGDTLLHAAAASGASNVISFVKRWMKLNTLNSKQQYPLHVACKSGLSIEAIHLLRECDITHKDIDGYTALDLLYKHHPNRQDLMACAMGSSYYIPGETSSPCSKEELISTEWFYDLSFEELDLHHMLHNNALHKAVYNGSIALIEELKKDHPDLFHKFVLEKNLYHYLPLHYAAFNRNINSIKLLSEGCDVNSVNILGHTCLHEACRSASNSDNDLEVVRFLIEDLKVDVNIGNNIGRTALHLACERGKTRIVKYILITTTANPDIKDGNNCTPLMLTSLDNHDIIKLLIEHGADTSPLYDTYKEFFKTYQSENPLPTPLNIIVAGKPSSGKSTLIKALCSDGSQTIVQAEPHTAGIIPSSHDSEELGCVSFYDLAGQSEYYASHEAVLHTVMASSTPLILLLVDCRKNQGLIQQDILYWLHFFKCQLPAIPRENQSKQTMPQVITVFSFADLIPIEIVQKKGTCSRMAIGHLFTNSGFHLAHSSFIDCRISTSNEIKQLRSNINESASILRDTSPVDFLLHCFYTLLLHSFKFLPMVSIRDVVNVRKQWVLLETDFNVLKTSQSGSSDEESDEDNEHTFEEENPANLLPDSSSHFVKLSKKLHQKGHIIFIKNHSNLENSWIIIDKEILLSKINGELYANIVYPHPDSIVSTSTGVVALSNLTERFPQYDISMLLELLLYLEYCQIITDECVLLLLSLESKYSSDTYYYFPGLVSIEKPQNVWNSLAGPVVQCGWILRVEDATSFFTPRLIQILLLRVAFQNAFPVKSWNRGFECPSICRSCCVWKNGIFWRNEVGTECLLEVAEQGQAVVLMFRSLKANLQENNLKKLLFVRSSVI